MVQDHVSAWYSAMKHWGYTNNGLTIPWVARFVFLQGTLDLDESLKSARTGDRQ